MQCDRCAKSAVVYQRYSGRHLCSDHLCADIESRAKRVIRQHNWLVKGDRIGVVSGAPHSEILMIFLSKLIGQRTDISLIAMDVPLIKTQTDATWYHTISAAATESGVTRIALADTAEDIAVQNLLSLLKGDAVHLLSREIPGLLIPWMQPFREIPCVELREYARHHNLPDVDFSPERDNEDCFQLAVRTLLAEYTRLHPSASHSLRRYGDNLCSLAEQK